MAAALKIRYSSEMLDSASNTETLDGSGRRVPSEAVRAQLETQMRQQADRVQSTVTEVRNIAARLKVDLDERAFTDSKFDTELSNQPEFVEARSRMFQERLIMRASESKYIDELVARARNP